MGRSCFTSISQEALLHNVTQVRHFAPGAKIMAMVKGNAYGHGLVQVAKLLSGHVEALGVACIEEANLLRAAGITIDIVLMEGIFNADELCQVQAQRFTLVVHHWPQIAALQAHKGHTAPFKVWLKLNTGMHRLGFQASEFLAAYQQLSQLPHCEIVGYLSHFSKADHQGDPHTEQQYRLFCDTIAPLPGLKSIANSAGILAWPKLQADWVRPGLMLYGVSPFADQWGTAFHLKPVMTLQAQIIAIRTLAAGDRVGYAGAFEAKVASQIGIVSIGYADGYPWHAKSGIPVLVNHQRTYTVGRVSMDMLAVDLSTCKAVKVGDPVILWGEGLPIEEVADHIGTIPWELLCRFKARV